LAQHDPHLRPLAASLVLATFWQFGVAAAQPEDALAILETHCVKCHGGEKTKGGLNLVTREALLKGGESGVAVVPGKPESSLLLRTVLHETDPHMPYKQEKLPAGAVRQLAAWVEAGAPYTRRLVATGTPTRADPPDPGSAHWAFQPVRRPTPPGGNDGRNSIDRFLLARLAVEGLSFSPPASRQTLIRRVTFDLIGLPPTPEEIDAFVGDPAPDAYEKLIDRLLASPRYGERWGRHWLDLARYAETDGFEHDAVRPDAWRYRDYVIASFNADKPYDRFIKEQIAGDELWPDDPDAVVATGFNLLGPDMVDSADQVQRRLNTLNDMTDTSALAFLGLTLGCARCHDHKFEPLSQRDYYSLQAFFTPARFVPQRSIASAEERAAYDEAMTRFDANSAVRELAALEAPAREKLRRQKLAKLSPEARAAHETPPERRTTEQANVVLETADMVEITDRELAKAFAGEAKARRQRLLSQVNQLPHPAPLPTAMALAQPSGPPSKTFILHRGDYNQPTEEVRPGFPAVLPPVALSSRQQGRRAVLADWIANKDNPLTARVMVNRIWQHHFGTGLVSTPSDFGTHGQPPTHPELLDYLASEFIARGWSIKQMHRLMLTSAAYRQVSFREETPAADPDNRLYWRMNRLRLEGEVVRDSLLAIGGKLNLQTGGPGVFPPIPADAIQGARGWTASKDPRDHARRSVYIFARRNLRFPFLEVFDAPDTNLSCPARERSTTAPQALTLLNADEVTQAAHATAKRVTEAAASADERITLLYRLALGRTPTADELSATREFLTTSPFTELCRVMFNLNDFIYVE